MKTVLELVMNYGCDNECVRRYVSSVCLGHRHGWRVVVPEPFQAAVQNPYRDLTHYYGPILDTYERVCRG